MMDVTANNFDNPTLSNDNVPSIPLPTYLWEDVRKAKEKGFYPWTYLKPHERNTVDSFDSATFPKCYSKKDIGRNTRIIDSQVTVVCGSEPNISETPTNLIKDFDDLVQSEQIIELKESPKRSHNSILKLSQEDFGDDDLNSTSKELNSILKEYETLLCDNVDNSAHFDITDINDITFDSDEINKIRLSLIARDKQLQVTMLGDSDEGEIQGSKKVFVENISTDIEEPENLGENQKLQLVTEAPLTRIDSFESENQQSKQLLEVQLPQIEEENQKPKPSPNAQTVESGSEEKENQQLEPLPEIQETKTGSVEKENQQSEKLSEENPAEIAFVPAEIGFVDDDDYEKIDNDIFDDCFAAAKLKNKTISLPKLSEYEIIENPADEVQEATKTNKEKWSTKIKRKTLKIKQDHFTLRPRSKSQSNIKKPKPADGENSVENENSKKKEFHFFTLPLKSKSKVKPKPAENENPKQETHFFTLPSNLLKFQRPFIQNAKDYFKTITRKRPFSHTKGTDDTVNKENESNALNIEENLKTPPAVTSPAPISPAETMRVLTSPAPTPPARRKKKHLNRETTDFNDIKDGEVQEAKLEIFVDIRPIESTPAFGLKKSPTIAKPKRFKKPVNLPESAENNSVVPTPPSRRTPPKRPTPPRRPRPVDNHHAIPIPPSRRKPEDNEPMVTTAPSTPKSGESNLRKRPLPPPPRPPRKQKTENIELCMIDSITFDKVNRVVQTDFLPEDFILDEIEIDENTRSLTPTKFRVSNLVCTSSTNNVENFENDSEMRCISENSLNKMDLGVRSDVTEATTTQIIPSTQPPGFFEVVDSVTIKVEEKVIELLPAEHTDSVPSNNDSIQKDSISALKIETEATEPVKPSTQPATNFKTEPLTEPFHEPTTELETAKTSPLATSIEVQERQTLELPIEIEVVKEICTKEIHNTEMETIINDSSSSRNDLPTVQKSSKDDKPYTKDAHIPVPPTQENKVESQPRTMSTNNHTDNNQHQFFQLHRPSNSNANEFKNDHEPYEKKVELKLALFMFIVMIACLFILKIDYSPKTIHYHWDFFNPPTF